jgi:hypothetical protein
MALQPEHVESAVAWGSQLLSYSDEMTIGGVKPSVQVHRVNIDSCAIHDTNILISIFACLQLSGAAIGATSLAVVGLFGALGVLLSKPGTGKVELSEQEASILADIESLYDTSPAEQVSGDHSSNAYK